MEPFEVTETKNTYDVLASVHGGGSSAQADAVRHGISRALVAASEALRGALRKAGLLTRDPREVEAQRYGGIGEQRASGPSTRSAKFDNPHDLRPALFRKMQALFFDADIRP